MTPLKILWALAGLLALILAFFTGQESGIGIGREYSKALTMQAYQEGFTQGFQHCEGARK